ncbi:hypothetical protein SCB29_34535 [Paraburkholderia sp. SIMBA_055]|uniref:hypothetical protein n=1 Tax=Paraburkholderia sp. SIMBA_054 TaxID=3085795 RepID=UPI0039794967
MDTPATGKYQPVSAAPRLESPNQASNGPTIGTPTQHATQAAATAPVVPIVPATTPILDFVTFIQKTFLGGSANVLAFKIQPQVT